MKLNSSNFKYKTMRLLEHHQVFVVTALVLMVATIVIVRISLLNARPIDQTRIDDETTGLTPVRIDEETVKRMQELRDSNVKVPGTQLPTDRDDPFNE